MRGVSAVFATYFGYVGIFSAYLSLFFAAQGFTVPQIAALVSITSMVRMFGPLLWGWWADHSNQPAKLLRLGVCGMLASVLFMPFATSFWGYALIIFCLFFGSSAVAPIAESLALQVSHGDTGTYGRIRIWGSAAFGLSVIVMGPILDWAGVKTLPWWMIAACTVLVIVPFRYNSAPIAKHAAQSAPIMKIVLRPEVILFFLSAFLMLIAHSALYTLYSLHLERMGFSKTLIGTLWVTAVIAEIFLFYFQKTLFDRFDARTLLLFSFGVATVRFLLIGMAGSNLLLLFVAQPFHAITFAVHHTASLNLLGGWFKGATQMRAQALYIVIAYGFGGTLGGLFLAQVWERVSPAAVFYCAAVAALLGALAVIGSNKLQSSH